MPYLPREVFTFEIIIFRIDSFSRTITLPSSSDARDSPKKKKQKSDLTTRYPYSPLPQGAALKKKQFDAAMNRREEDKDDPPTSPIEDPSAHQSLMPIVNENQENSAIATGSSTLCLEVKRRVARHITMKQNKAIPPRSKNMAPFSSGGPVIEKNLVFNGAIDIPNVSAESVSRVVTSSRDSEARHSAERNRRSQGQLEAEKRKSSKRGKQVLVSPAEYAQRRIDTNTPRDSIVQFLEGKRIFYIGGDMQYAGERTRKRMELVCQ